MSNYGRYGEFRVSPRPEDRGGRFISPAALIIPQFAPVATTGVVNADGRSLTQLATGHTAPFPGAHGIAIWENAFASFAGFDPVITDVSDFSDIPVGTPIQVVHGTYVKISLKNIAANTVFFGRTYTDARTFVAPTNLSTISVGDLLCPGTGNGTSGYWAEVAGGQEADAWLKVTSIDSVRGSVEAQMLF